MTDQNEPQSAMEMPRYRCHKQVWALKIKDISYDSDRARTENRETDGSALLVPEDKRYGPIRVIRDYLSKHNPQPGGYYVVYRDGYKSWSPAKAFEEGYAPFDDRTYVSHPWAHYRRKVLSEMRPYVPGEPMDGISVSEADRANGSPKEGDMIARNPIDHADQCLVAAQYFADNLEPA